MISASTSVIPSIAISPAAPSMRMTVTPAIAYAKSRAGVACRATPLWALGFAEHFRREGIWMRPRTRDYRAIQAAVVLAFELALRRQRSVFRAEDRAHFTLARSVSSSSDHEKRALPRNAFSTSRAIRC